MRDAPASLLAFLAHVVSADDSQLQESLVSRKDCAYGKQLKELGLNISTAISCVSQFPDDLERPEATSIALIVAVLSGLVGTCATLAITFPTRRAARRKVPLSDCSKRLMFATNLTLIGLQNVLLIFANGRAPVSLTFPLASGVNILSILIGQWWLGLFKPSKPVRIGTYILAFAVFMLPNVGPSDTPADINVVDLVTTTQSIVFITLCAFVTAYGLFAIKFAWVEGNNNLLLLYALLAGTGTVLNASISKVVQLDLGVFARICLVIVYVILSGLALGIQAVANSTLVDPSAYVPVSVGVNLVLNFFAGICIWGDWNRVEYHVAYIFIYVLVFCGAYSITSFDVIADGNLHLPRLKHVASFRQKLYAHIDYSSDVVHRAGVYLWQLWESECDDPSKTRRALEMYLEYAIAKKLVNVHNLAELVVQLTEETPPSPGTFHSIAIEKWLLRNVDSFRECRRDVRETSTSDSSTGDEDDSDSK